MTYTILLFITRQPTLTPEEFKTYWDTKHVALLKEIAGDKFPITHTRHYIARPTETTGAWPATVLVGDQDDFWYDGIAELVFEDEEGFRTFFGIISAPENAARIAEDEEKFALRDKMKAVVLGATSVTSR